MSRLVGCCCREADTCDVPRPPLAKLFSLGAGVPRVQLSNHSPFYIMFQKEPFAENDFSNVNAKKLDLPEFFKRFYK